MHASRSVPLIVRVHFVLGWSLRTSKKRRISAVGETRDEVEEEGEEGGKKKKK